MLELSIFQVFALVGILCLFFFMFLYPFFFVAKSHRPSDSNLLIALETAETVMEVIDATEIVDTDLL